MSLSLENGYLSFHPNIYLFTQQIFTECRLCPALCHKPRGKLFTNQQGVENGGQCRVEARGLSDMQGMQITCWGKAPWTRDI